MEFICPYCSEQSETNICKKCSSQTILVLLDEYFKKSNNRYVQYHIDDNLHESKELIKKIRILNSKITGFKSKLKCSKCKHSEILKTDKYGVPRGKFLCTHEKIYNEEYAMFGFNCDIYNKSLCLNTCPLINSVEKPLKKITKTVYYIFN